MTLRKAAEALLFYPGDYKMIYDAVRELHDYYAPITGIAAGNIEDKDIFLPEGKAISPTKAAFCLLEGQRTAVFLRGIYKAILQLQQQFPGEKLNILYAGCGPYATLLTPLTAMFRPDEVYFYLLDINDISLTAVKKLYEAAGLTDYVADYICADATTYKTPVPMHLMISETMKEALVKEPQVAIMLNLVPQLPEGGLFIPQAITVSAKLLSARQETDRYMNPDVEPERIHLGDLYTIGQASCERQQPVTIQIPDELKAGKDLYMLTDITVFDNEKLGINDCSLNIPQRVQRVEGYEGKRLSFTYNMGEKPGFVHAWKN